MDNQEIHDRLLAITEGCRDAIARRAKREDL
jgi:hypothetical protein